MWADHGETDLKTNMVKRSIIRLIIKVITEDPDGSSCGLPQGGAAVRFLGIQRCSMLKMSHAVT